MGISINAKEVNSPLYSVVDSALAPALEMPGPQRRSQYLRLCAPQLCAGSGSMVHGVAQFFQ